jgi:trehalose 6-phosphate synthase
MFAKELQELVNQKLGDTRLIIASNREPYIHSYEEEEIRWRKVASGMVSALDPVAKASNCLWIAAGLGSADKETVDERGEIKVPPSNPKYTLRRIELSRKEEEGYYYGLANEAIWPLSHMAYQRPRFEEWHWNEYKRVNRLFADTILEEIGRKGAFVWIQDYHLSLLPKLIKEQRPDVKVGHFWHIPWPNSEKFRIFPWKEELLEGLLGSDLLGFHIRYHCNNFIDTIRNNLEARIDMETSGIIYGDHQTLIRSFPIGIDFEGVSQKAKEANELVRQLNHHLGLKGEIIAVGVNRIDYTKGIPEAIEAIDKFLTKYPEYQGKFTFIQHGLPSRTHLPIYKRLNDRIEEMIEDLNWKYGYGKWQPIIYLKGELSFKEILALYKMAELCIISSLQDGMNLVAKEFLATQSASKGMLVLSEFAGAARELGDALLINPYDKERFAGAIKEAIEMPKEERKRRMERMRQIIRENNVYKWAGDFISTIMQIS